jgi:hypothetical protein
MVGGGQEYLTTEQFMAALSENLGKAQAGA